MSDSRIVKAPFVAMSDIKKSITIIDPNDPKIVNSYKKHDDIEVEAEKDQPEADEEHQEEEVEETVSIEEVKLEIEQMLADARLEAEMIKNEAIDQGYKEGFAQGQNESKIQLDEAVASLELERQQLKEAVEEEKETFFSEVEKKTAVVISDLVERLVGSNEDPDLIVYLIRLAFDEIHVHGHLIVRVSSDDYDYLIEHKRELSSGLSEKIDIEILSDSTLMKNQCMIESEQGNVDCSLSLRLENLKRELKLIGDSLK